MSWLHGSGLNLTLAHSQREIPVALPDSRDGKLDYVKIGYKFGKHAIAADYGKQQPHRRRDASLLRRAVFASAPSRF